MSRNKIEIIDITTGAKQIFKVGNIVTLDNREWVQCLYNDVIWTHCPREVLKGEKIEEDGLTYELL